MLKAIRRHFMFRNYLFRCNVCALSVSAVKGFTANMDLFCGVLFTVVRLGDIRQWQC